MNDQWQCTSYVHYNSPMLTICVHLTYWVNTIQSHCVQILPPSNQILGGGESLIQIPSNYHDQIKDYTPPMHIYHLFCAPNQFNLFLSVRFCIMAPHTYPCPRCGIGVFVLGNRHFKAHLHYCSKSNDKDPVASPSIPNSSVDATSAQLFQSDRELFESIWNTTSDPFKFTNINNEQWELDNPIPSSDSSDSDSSNQNTFTSDVISTTERESFHLQRMY